MITAVEAPAAPHRIQALQLLSRWRSRAAAVPPAAAADCVPPLVPLSGAARTHYQRFAFVVCEQRLLVMLLAAAAAAAGIVWSLALRMHAKPPLVIRGAPSLKEAAAAFYGAPEVSYDQVAFFLHGCLPLLFAAGREGHPFLALDEGLVAPEICEAAARRLGASRQGMEGGGVAQHLEITSVGDLDSDPGSGRAAASVEGRLVVIVRDREARFFPWKARVLLERSPGGRLNPYPFYLARLEQRAGPAAVGWAPDRAFEAGSAPERP
jgi:hypothetical protein